MLHLLATMLGHHLGKFFLLNKLILFFFLKQSTYSIGDFCWIIANLRKHKHTNTGWQAVVTRTGTDTQPSLTHTHKLITHTNPPPHNPPHITTPHTQPSPHTTTMQTHTQICAVSVNQIRSQHFSLPKVIMTDICSRCPAIGLNPESWGWKANLSLHSRSCGSLLMFDLGWLQPSWFLRATPGISAFPPPPHAPLVFVRSLTPCTVSLALTST